MNPEFIQYLRERVASFSGTSNEVITKLDELLSEPLHSLFTWGVFDRFHIGHMDFLWRVKQHLGNGPSTRLIISLDTDDFAKTYKGRDNIQSQWLRAATIYEYARLIFPQVLVMFHDSTEELDRNIIMMKPQTCVFSLARGEEKAREHTQRLEPILETVGSSVIVIQEFTPIHSSQLI